MSDSRRIILVHRSPADRDGGDPAVDFDADGVAVVLSQYQRTRSDEDRARVPLRAGMRPAEFEIQRVSQAAMRFIRGGQTPLEQCQRAVLAGCHAFTDARGAEHKAKVVRGDTFALADDAWLDAIADEFGGAAVLELGAAVIQLSEARKAALAPFGSVPGLVLAR